jgi:hypothetical protein
MALWFTQPLTEIGSRNLSGGKAWPAHKADNLTPYMNLLSRKCGILDTLQPYSPPQPVSEIALFLSPPLPSYISEIMV